MKGFFIIIFLLSFTTDLFAQAEVRHETVPDEFRDYIYADSEDIAWFSNAKFGVFVHWGPYTLAGVPASWGRFGPRPGAGRQATEGVPQEEYDNLYKKFNPVDFDAEEWIKMVKDAGAKYFIFTTKHHDGFCMFDAKNTDYKITSTPFGRDVAKEIADACHKYGVKLFWYYSQPDWQHPDCLTENNERYRTYMYEHLEQLFTNYGKIDGLFFDGLGTKYYDWDTPRMLKMIRTLQPGIIINRRWGAGIPGFPISGDYDNPEQQFGAFGVERPWEMCCTISEAWSWTNGERFKTYHTNQRMFIQTVCSGGNIAINTGPSPLGSINPPDVEIYRNIGEWLKKYGESVYETKGGPYKPGAWGGSTRKGNVIYLHLLADFAVGTKKEIVLPLLPGKINKVSILSGGEVEVTNTAGKLTVLLSGKINKLDNLVKLELENDVENMAPIETVFEGTEITRIHGSASSSPGKFKSPATVFGESGNSFAEGKRHKIWWSPAEDDKQPWIRAEFQKKEKIEFIMLAEQIRNCSVREFRIDYLDNGNWKTLYNGNEIGMDFCLKVDDIDTNSLRVTVLNTNQERIPAIGVFRVFKK